MVKEYNARGGPIQIQFERAAGTGTEEHHEKIAIEMAGGVAPDVFEMKSKRMPSFVHGRLMDLTKRFAASKKVPKAAFFPGDWTRAFWAREAVPAAPVRQSRRALLPRRVVPEAGLPPPPDKADDKWTWARFLETAQRLSNPGEGTFGYNQNNWWVYLEPWIWSNGGDFLSKDRKRVIMDEPAAQQAITFAVELRLKHRVMPEAGELQAAGGRAGHVLRRPAGHADGHLQLVRVDASAPRRAVEHRTLAARPQSYTPRSPATMWAMDNQTKHADRAFEALEHFGSRRSIGRYPCSPRAGT